MAPAPVVQAPVVHAVAPTQTSAITAAPAFARFDAWLDTELFSVEGSDVTHVVNFRAVLLAIVVFCFTAVLKRRIKRWTARTKSEAGATLARAARSSASDPDGDGGAARLKAGLVELEAEAEVLRAKKEAQDAKAAAAAKKKKKSPKKKRTKKAQD